MTQEIKHSPLPWNLDTQNSDRDIIDGNRETLLTCFGEVDNEESWQTIAIENAKFVLRACNSYYQLVEALEKVWKNVHSIESGINDFEDMVDKIEKALKHAKGE